MDNALEASSQRIRNHLRRPIPGRVELLNENARNTVNEIVRGGLFTLHCLGLPRVWLTSICSL